MREKKETGKESLSKSRATLCCGLSGWWCSGDGRDGRSNNVLDSPNTDVLLCFFLCKEPKRNNNYKCFSRNIVACELKYQGLF